MKIARLVLVCTASVVVLVSTGQSQEKKIAATVVKYDALKQEVLKHRGKVVLVDFWATWCPSCMAAFPKFIEKQQKYGDKGLVVISVSLDKTDAVEIDAAAARASRFLTKVKSPLRNLVLDEPAELWSKKFGIDSLPCYFVFDRHGKWVRFHGKDSKDGEVNYDAIEKVVVEMLNEK